MTEAILAPTDSQLAYIGDLCAKQGHDSDPAHNGAYFGKIQFHHIVSREDFGDDVADNIVPLCPFDHDLVTRRDKGAGLVLMLTLTDAEYACYAERAYGLEYRR